MPLPRKRFFFENLSGGETIGGDRLYVENAILQGGARR